MYRLRVKFNRGGQLKFLSHLDLMRLWERALRRAGISPAYSEGFSPHPRISMAAPLAVGVTSRAEMMDIFMEQRISYDLFIEKVKPQLPDGISIIEVITVSPQAPSLQSRLCFAEYEVIIETEDAADKMRGKINDLLAKEQLPWHHLRDTGEKYYDLRPLIDDLWLIEKQETSGKIGMKLRCDASGTGRPEQIARALGYEEFPMSIERTNLLFA
jgi:radical SAM-linked protein